MPVANTPFFPCQRGIPHERRIICAAYSLWEEIRGNQLMPRPGDYRPDAWPQIAPHVYVVQIEGRGGCGTFVVASEILDQAMGVSSLGRSLAATLPADYRDQFMSYVAGVVMYQKPLTESGVFFSHDGNEILYRNILTPVSDDGRRVTHILGAFNYMGAK